MMEATTFEDKFLRGFSAGEGGECWEWTGGKDRDGYGQFTHAGHSYRAHRVAYERRVGEIPEGLVIDHRCKNPACCNPEHLEPVTNRTNILRGDGPAARNAHKTHCKHGHEFTEENTYYYENGDYPHGRRQCKTCVMERAGYTGPESN